MAEKLQRKAKWMNAALGEDDFGPDKHRVFSSALLLAGHCEGREKVRQMIKPSDHVVASI